MRDDPPGGEGSPAGEDPAGDYPAGERRANLAAQQAELLGALVADGFEPAGFDPERLRTQAEMLRAKRRRVVSGHCPDVVRRLGERFVPLFEQYCREHPPRAERGARDDALGFHGWLVRQGVLDGPTSRFFRRVGEFLPFPRTRKST